ncbi:spore coat protein [Desulfolucanica intricata]|uniref:spore coat protein n=1 Tax=Desulfolucanica intricata TaxID=1285191 RepID=UPI00082996C9|nr:spore coat protein [Desulfolucanica intricata]
MFLSDKDIMTDLLNSTKMMSSNYHKAVLESANDRIRNTLIQINNEELDMQKRIFDMMHDKGYYPVEPARTSITPPDYTYRPMQQPSMQQPHPQPQIRY